MKRFTRVLGVGLPLVMVLVLAVALLPAASTPTAEASPGELCFSNIPLPKFWELDDGFVLTPGTDVGAIAAAPGGLEAFAAPRHALHKYIHYYVTANITGADMELTITYQNANSQECTTSFTIPQGSSEGDWGDIPLGWAVVSITNIEETGNPAAQGAFGIGSSATFTTLAYFNDTSPTDYSPGFYAFPGPHPFDDLYKSTDGGYTWNVNLFCEAARAQTPRDTFRIVDIAVSPQYSSDNTVFVATEDYVYQSLDGGENFAAMLISGWQADETITDLDVALDSGNQPSVIIGSSTDNASTAGDVYVYCPATTGTSWQAQSIGTDVLAVAFLPSFASDDGISAVTCDSAVTKIQFALGSTASGGGWGDSIGDGEFLNRDGDPIADTERARMAFPDDFDVDSITSNIVFVGLADDDTGTADEEGDVFKVTLETKASSTAVDLNVRGVVGLQPTATNIWSIDVSGSATAANILVGTDFWSSDNYWLSYYSLDGGQSWLSAGEKSPTGAATGLGTPTDGAQTNVVMAPDFATSGVAYAATRGDETSAFSRTADGGKSWNQISLIDYSDTTNYYTVSGAKFNVVYSMTPEAYMVTAIVRDTYGMAMVQVGGSLWKTTNGGGNWERIWSYANPTVTASIDSVDVKGDALFAKDRQNGKFWRSLDGGATFPTVVPAKMGFLAVANIVDETSIDTVDSNGAIWTTTDLGQPWVKPDESDVEGYYPTRYDRHGDIILVGTSGAGVFVSTDAGQTFTEKLGTTDLPGYVGVAFDNDYDVNHFVYATVGAYGGGIWRIELNEEDPDSTEWQRIDADSPGAGSVVSYVGFQMGSPTLYCWDYMSVNTTANTGGLWLSRNPAADIEGLSPPLFEKTQTGLTTGMAMGYLGYAVSPNTVFMRDTSAAGTSNCHKQVYAFADDVNQVSINAPDRVSEGCQFTVTVDISEVENLDACNYDVSFDSAVLELDSVTSGDIGGTVIPVDIWNEISPGTFTIVQNVPGVGGVSGSGHLAVLHFHVIGSIGDSSDIGLSNGMLSSNLAEEILTIWVGDSIEVAVIPGDANGDAVVNAVDITKTERIIAGLVPPTPGADCNGDGTVNALDITCIERLIIGVVQYVNDEYGFSFKYPNYWIDTTEEGDIFGLQAPSGFTGLWISVLDAAEGATFADALGGETLADTLIDLEILSVYGTTLADGTPASCAEFNATVTDWPMHLFAIGLIHGDYWVMIVMWNIDTFAPYDEALFEEIGSTLTVY